MSAAPQLIPEQSTEAAAVAMSPANINAKIAGLQSFDAQQKADDAQEVVLGINKGDVKELGASFLDGGIAPPGLAAMAAPLGIVSSMFTKDYFSKRELAELTDQYRDLIAAKLNMDAEAVDESHLKALAMKDTELAQSLIAIANKRDAHVANNAVGVGGMMAGAAAGAAAGSIVPIYGTAIGFLGGLAGGALGYEVGEGLAKYLTDTTDATNPAAIVEALQQKKADGNYITTQDVFALQLAKHPEKREAIVFQYGDNFHMLDEATQKEVMAREPWLYQRAARDATSCNFPEADIRQLLFGEMTPAVANENVAPASTQWTSRIANERAEQMAMPKQRSWTEAILQRRAAQTAQEQML